MKRYNKGIAAALGSGLAAAVSMFMDFDTQQTAALSGAFGTLFVLFGPKNAEKDDA